MSSAVGVGAGLSPENLENQLKSKRICRFCMTQKEPLTNIYSKENRVNSLAPLPLQIMACVSIEVFTNDGMPNMICEKCRLFMEHWYRFKQMCKKADTTFRQFPLTGIWPEPLDVPKIPDGLLKLYEIKRPTILNAITPVKIEKAEEATVTVMKQERPILQSIRKTPKILNKSSVKILNKSAHVTEEPILSNPIITRNECGQVEIVTEIIDNNQTRLEEPDPVLTAEPIETNVFPCPHCERSFPLRQLLDIHMVNHNRERSFACETCDKRFFSKYDLGKHTLIHTGEKPYQCVVCKKSFTRSTLLHRHEKVHTDQPKFLCVYCEKPFLSKEELEKHTDRHKKNRPFHCKICGKSFAFKQGLERHETVHAKDQPFPCQYCDQSFSTPSKLSRHLTAHAGERPFPCKLCPKSYLLSHHLTRHLRSHTQGSGSYKCYDCERTFTTRDDLIYHSAVHATQNLMCPLCKEQFENLDQVTEHIKRHAEGEQYACEFCDLIFLTADKLQRHSDSEHADDMAAYEKNQYANSSADDTEQGEEVLQEFIIEEYHAEDEGIINQIKQEKEIVSDDELEPVQRKTTTLQPTRIYRQAKQIKQQEQEQHEEEMEVEELEQKEVDDDDYQPEKEDDDGDDNYEPPAKTIKTTRKISPRGKQSNAIPAASVKESNNFKAPIVRKQPHMVQQTITSVLKHLPKSVTVVKKEKQTPPAAPVAEIKSDAASKGIRILNEKIIQKADPKRKSPEPSKILDIKTPVKVIESKVIRESTSGSGMSTRSRPTSQPGTSKASPSAATPPEKKVITKQSPLPSPSSSQQKISPQQQQQKSSLSSPPSSANKKLVEMMIDNRKVKVQKIVMTKAEVAAMAKEGKIEMKGGTMLLKQSGKTITGKVISKTAAGASSNK